MRRRLAFLIYLSAPLLPSQTPAGPSITNKDVIDRLDRAITWYRRVADIDQSSSAPENLVLQNNVHEGARQVLKLGFDYARAQATLLASQAGTGAATPAQTMQQASANAAARAARAQSQIDELDDQLAKAKTAERPTLAARRKALMANLALAKDVQAAIKNMVSFASAPQGANSSRALADRIDDLESLNAAVDAPDNAAKAAAQNDKAAAAVPIFHPESAGVIALISKATTLASDRSQLDSLRNDTDMLLGEIGQWRAPIRTSLRSTVAQSDAIVNAGDATTPADWDARRKQIEALSARFKQLSSVLAPLGQQAIVLQPIRGGIEEWRNALDRQYRYALRFLFVRIGGLVVAILVLLLASALWQRAIFRYVHDPRRRRQFMVFKRIVVGFAMALTLALGFLSSFGSVATLLGFITAGLALALQNVILSVVAYFFLVGRYGLRAGDRVTVSGVTGQVMEVGLVRLFLMELSGTGADLHPTGRVAAFANSIIFQPAALMKQTAGVDYAWHSVSVTLAEPFDHAQARERIAGAVEQVYDEYRPAIERQHDIFERNTNMQTSAPRPVTRANFTGAGLEILIRYPADAAHASSMDDRIVSALWDEAAKEPKLQFAAGGTPKSTLAYG